MRLRAAEIAAVAAMTACGDDGGDVTAEPLPGAPAAVRALLAADGDLIVIGGDSAFGLHRLQHFRDGRWTVAEGVPPFGARATLIGGDAVYAASDTALYRLDDDAELRWSDARPIPPPAPVLIGTAGETILGAIDDDGDGALVALPPERRVWQEIARPLGAGARGFVVGDGRVTWADPARGVLRAEGGTITLVADCGDCVVPVLAVTEDAVIACGTGTPPTGAFRLRDELVPLELPDDRAPCVAASGGAGHGVLVTEDAVLTLAPSASAWKRISAAVTGLTYVHAGDAIYAFGDGISARGVFVLDL